MYFYVEYGVALITKQMYPESVEKGKSRVTEMLSPNGRVRREFSQHLMNVCVPTEVLLFAWS